MHRTSPTRGRGPGVAVRFALALLLSLSALGAVASLGAQSRVAAQSASELTTAAIVPDTALIYFAIPLTIDSDQWVIASELLTKMGQEGVEGAADSVTEQVTGDGSDLDILGDGFAGGEIALVGTNTNLVQEAAGGLSEQTGDIGVDLPVGTPEAGSTGEIPSGAALVIAPVDMTLAVAALDASLAATAETTGNPITEQTYNGVTIKVVAGDEMSGAAGSSYAVVGDFLVLSETGVDIHPMIDVAGGSAPALGDHPAFKQAMGVFEGDHIAYGFLNGPGLVSDLSSATASDSPELASVINGLTGTNRFTGIALSAAAEGFRIDTVEIPATEGETLEAGGAAADLTMADKLPADSLIFINGFNLGKGAFLNGVGLLLVSLFAGMSSGETPATPAASVDELYAQAAELLGFNLKTDFIDQMVGEYSFAVWGLDLTNPAGIGAVLTSEVASVPTVSLVTGTLGFILAAAMEGQAQVETETLENGAITSAQLPIDENTSLGISFGIANERFMFGIGNGVETALNGAATPMSQNPDYTASLALLPAEHDGVFFVNMEAAGALLTSVGDMSMDGESGVLDAHPSCAEFASQVEAQAAYDENPISNMELDQDFDGEACEDYFTVAEPDAESGGEVIPGVRAIATVSYKQDGLGYTSTIVLVGE